VGWLAMPFIKRVIGTGLTDSMSLFGGDLGIMRWDDKRKCIASVLGDNFSKPNLQGTWRGPSVILFDEDYNPCGIPTMAGPGNWSAKGINRPIGQLWPFQHTADPPFTILPTDMICIGGNWIVSVIVAEGRGNEVRTEFHVSNNLVDWNSDPVFSIDHTPANSHPGMVMLTFEADNSGYIYIFGTGGLKRDQPIWLWRCLSITFPGGEWEPYGHNEESGWAWGTPNETTPVINGQYGELCLRMVEDSWVLSFFDQKDYCVSAIRSKSITGEHCSVEKITLAVGEAPSHKLLDVPLTVIPQLYGPYISPLSKLSDMRFFVSQWNTETNDPYTISLISSAFQEEIKST
jgi:hypothetical protein